MLQLERLTIGYRIGRRTLPVASNLVARLEAGRLTVLVGPNGAGKSTLMRTLAGLQPPLAGTARLDGRAVDELSPRERARRIAVVLTGGPRPWGLSGRDLVALGRHPHTGWDGRLSDADVAAVSRALEEADATVLASRPVHELSDGECQRLRVARALAQEPQLLVLDEVTSFLDLPHRVAMMRTLRRLAHDSGRALLLSTHDLELALRTADDLWVLGPGGSLETGPPEELALRGVLAAAFVGEGLDFDHELGGFRLVEPHGRAIALRGQGPAALWTRRALERLGFTVDGTAAAGAGVVEVGEDVFRFSAGGATRDCDSLRELLELVRGTG